MKTLPTHLGGYQHLAPDVIVQKGDIYVDRGEPREFCGLSIGHNVGVSETLTGYNIYRLIPVARQGDIDDCGWKAKRDALKAELEGRDDDRREKALAESGHDRKPGVISARALGCNALPTAAAARKGIPLYSGLLKYFPDALCAVAELSRIGNEQHNPGKPLHWDRSKSGDEADALMRHLLQCDEMDSDGTLHAVKVAWRGLALAQKKIEDRKK